MPPVSSQIQKAMLKTNAVKTILIALVFAVTPALFVWQKAYAEDCESNYGGCEVDRGFDIKKFVMLDEDNDWDDEVTIDLNDDGEDGEANKDILFKIEVTFTAESDDVDVTDINADNMKMVDNWPDELKFLDDESRNDLIEEWDNFEANTTKTFYLRGKLRDSEKDKNGNFVKCVFNSVELFHDGDEVDDDEVSVCWKKTTEGEILGAQTALPKTGPSEVATLAGIATTFAGLVLRKKFSL